MTATAEAPLAGASVFESLITHPPNFYRYAPNDQGKRLYPEHRWRIGRCRALVARSNDARCWLSLADVSRCYYAKCMSMSVPQPGAVSRDAARDQLGRPLIPVHLDAPYIDDVEHLGDTKKQPSSRLHTNRHGIMLFLPLRIPVCP